MEQLPVTQAGSFPICSHAVGWSYIYFDPINSSKYGWGAVAENVTE
jgi:hypothetical protein